MLAVAGLVVVGTVVAILPAQESSRRTASKYRSGAPAAALPADPTALLPIAVPPGLAPIVTPFDAPAATAQPGLPPTSMPSAEGYQPASPPAGEIRGSAFVPEAAPLPVEPAALETTATAGEVPTTEPPAGDEGPLRSVLKRTRPPIVAETSAALPPSNTIPAASPRPNTIPAASLPPNTMPSVSPPSARRSSPTAVPAARTAATPAIAPNGRSIQDLAVAGRSPALRVEIAGPQGITVGKPATYVVTLANESDAVAEEVLLRIALPGWVNVSGSQPSHGDVALQPAEGGSRLVWTLPRVAAKSQSQLRLALVSSSGESFDLSAEWTCRPSTVRAAIRVKQPQLELSLAGPAEMTFGEEKTFTLTVSNPGTGDAEQVRMQVSSGNAPAHPIEVGTLPAGTKKEYPLTVVASQAGEMMLRAVAGGEGGLEAQTSGKIVVRKAEVSLAVAGPPLKYAGTEAIYNVTVTNSGSAAADNVNLSLALPPSAKYLGGIDGAAAAGGSLKWKIATLAAGTQRTYDVRLQLLAAGANRIAVQAQSAAAGETSAMAETEVEAISDLKLVVNDPAGPLPLGEQAIYEVQVMNRGSQAAQRVKIIMQFGDGVEPVAFEGCEARLVPGQVLCQPLAQLGAGEQVTLRVRAKGQKVGTHQFRIEVTSSDGDTRLVSEGTTRFFSETGRTGAAATTARNPAEPRPIQR